MPRRGGGGRSPSPMSSAPRRNMTTAAPARAAPPPQPPVPVNPAANMPANAMPGQRGPGMMGQIASTAIGVGIGSAVGHAVGHAMVGGNRGEAAPAQQNPNEQGMQQQQQYQQAPYGYQQAQPSANACEIEMRQFLECAQQNSSDISMCTGYNELLKQCRQRYGMQM